MTMSLTRVAAGLAACAALAACLPGDTGPQPKIVERNGAACAPYMIGNDRLAGIGVDLCSDGRVFNWNGDLAGSAPPPADGMVTVAWIDGGVAGGPPTETYTAAPQLCRATGTLNDC